MSDKTIFEIEQWPIENIHPYDKNAKVHSDKQVGELAASIKALGFTSPLVVDKDGVLIAGHGRRLACIELGLKKVPVICRRDLTTSEANALRLADNKMASIEYDQELLALSMTEIDPEHMDLSGYEETDFSMADEDEAMTVSHEYTIDDVGLGVSQQRKANEEAAVEIDGRDLSMARALGFSKITTQQARRVKKAMAEICHETGKSGIDALIAHFDELELGMGVD